MAASGAAGPWPRPFGQGACPLAGKAEALVPPFTCHLSRVFCIMTAHVKTRRSNFARHCAVDAARWCGPGRSLQHVLRNVRWVPLVQYDVSVMKINLLVVNAGNLIVTEVPEV